MLWIIIRRSDSLMFFVRELYVMGLFGIFYLFLVDNLLLILHFQMQVLLQMRIQVQQNDGAKHRL